MPVTVSAKTGDLAAQWQRGVPYVLAFLREYYWLAAAYVAGTIVLLRRGGLVAWWAVLAAIVITGDLLFSVLVGGDWMLGYRFVVPILPIAVVTIHLAIAPRGWTCCIVSAVLVAFGLYTTVPLNRAAIAQARSDLGDIRMGQYIRDLGLPAGSSIAVIDAGAIPYYAGLPTIDMVGLNNAHIAKLAGGFMGKWDNEYVLAQRPQVIQFHTHTKDGTLFPSEVFLGTVRLYYSQEFQRWYAFDPNAPVSHLFRRRAAPLPHSFMDTFYDAGLSLRYAAAAGKLAVQVRKPGDGVWLASTQARVEGGAVYVRVRQLGQNGEVVFERLVALPRDMRKGDEATVDVAMPHAEADKLSACLVLAGVADFPGCRAQ
jgi:hypothetical protein